MNYSELEELFNKISFHMFQIDNNINILNTLVEDLGIEDHSTLAHLQTVLRTFYSIVQEKYETRKNEIIREEEK